MATPAARAVLGRPNVLVTGTPGTGKTTTAAAIAVCVWVGFVVWMGVEGMGWRGKKRVVWWCGVWSCSHDQQQQYQGGWLVA